MKYIHYLVGTLIILNMILIMIVLIKINKDMELENLKRSLKNLEDKCSKEHNKPPEPQKKTPTPKSNRGIFVTKEDIIHAIKKLKKENNLKFKLDINKPTVNNTKPTCNSPDSGCYLDTEKESLNFDDELKPIENTMPYEYMLNGYELSRLLMSFDQCDADDQVDTMLHLFEGYFIKYPSSANTVLEYFIYISLKHAQVDLITDDSFFNIYKLFLMFFLKKKFLVFFRNNQETSYSSEFDSSSFECESVEKEIGELRGYIIDSSEPQNKGQFIYNYTPSQDQYTKEDNFYKQFKDTLPYYSSRIFQRYEYLDFTTNELKNEIINVFTLFYIQLKDNLKEKDQEIFFYICDCIFYVFHQSAQMFEMKLKLETIIN